MINSTGQLARIISSIGIELAGKPQDSTETKATVEATKSGFEFVRERLEHIEPPPGYEELHQRLLDALSFYTEASVALLPASQTGKGNYSLFQELMLQGSKNFHAAGAELPDLARRQD